MWRPGCSSRLSRASRGESASAWRWPGRWPRPTAAASAGGERSVELASKSICRWNLMKHILIIDDEEAVCWALERALTREGHQVAVTASAEEALELAARQRPDAIILDLRLPGLDCL